MAEFRIDQGTQGTPGQSRHDLSAGAEITLVVTSPTGGGGETYTWEILDKVGSTATLSSTSGSTVTLGAGGGPIVAPCSFLIKLTADDGAGNVTDDTRIASVLTANTQLRVPLFPETSPSSNKLSANDPDKSTDNAVYTDRAGLGSQEQNWRGWAEWAYRLVKEVENLSGISVSGNTAPSILVGNSPNGDTSGQVDYLDAGDGVELANALAAAGPGSNVYIRPGTYDLGAGSQSAPFSIPAEVKVEGAGKQHVTIRTKSSGDMGAFVFNSSGDITLKDLTVEVALPTGVGSGSTAVINSEGSSNVIEDVLINFLGTYTAGEINNLNLTRALLVGTGSCKLNRLSISNAPSYASFGIQNSFECVGVVAPTDITESDISDGDVGISASSVFSAIGVNISDSYNTGINAGSGSAGSLISGGSVVAPTDIKTGIYLGDAGIRVVGVHLNGPSLATGSVGIDTGNGGLNINELDITGCRITDFETGITIDANDSVVVSNMITTDGDGIIDTGTGNLVGHNKVKVLVA